MKPIYKSLVLANMALAVTLSLQANVTSDSESTPQAVNAETLEGLKVTIVSPNVSGARDLIASGECVISNDELQISLDGSKLVQGTTHRILVQMEYGTNTVVLYGLNVTVPRYVTLANGTQEYADNVVVVSTFGDGAGTPFDPTEMQAEIDQLQLNMAGKADAQETAQALAEKQPIGDYANGSIYKVGESGEEGSKVENVSKVIGHSVELSSACEATGLHAVAEGKGKATGDYSHAEGTSYEQTQIASTNASGDASHAEGAGTTASGDASHAEGGGTTASGDASHAEGGETTASGDVSHAEGARTTASGGAAHAEGNGTTASGNTAHAEGFKTTASGESAHAEGFGTIANSAAQHASGMYNVVDTNGDYALIVGNGTSDNARSNAFAIDWSGNLVLFNAGTPVVLTPAKLATLIA